MAAGKISRSDIRIKRTEHGRVVSFDHRVVIFMKMPATQGIISRGCIKETVSRDFRHMIFVINQLSLGP
jgi:hypothetical protein